MPNFLSKRCCVNRKIVCNTAPQHPSVSKCCCYCFKAGGGDTHTSQWQRWGFSWEVADSLARCLKSSRALPKVQEWVPCVHVYQHTTQRRSGGCSYRSNALPLLEQHLEPIGPPRAQQSSSWSQCCAHRCANRALGCTSKSVSSGHNFSLCDTADKSCS